MKWTIKTIGELFTRWGVCKQKKSSREKAIELINAWFDGKDIIMKDPEHGVKNWVSIHDPDYWSFLGEFIREIDKYKIIDET